jgi:UDP-glucose 4-epimerase
MKKILITGNSGYIGSHLSQILVRDKNLEVHGLDKVAPVISLHKQIIQDISQDVDWKINEEYDCVIHLAAEVAVGRSVIEPTKYYLTNTVGTFNILNKIKSQRFAIASTGAAGGLGSPYGISKRAMEDIVTEWCVKNKIPFTIFRFYNVVGKDGINPTNPDGLFYSLIAAEKTGRFTLFGDDYNTKDGSCIRDYTHVNEICQAVLNGIYDSTNGIENLGHGIGTSVKEMIDIYKKVNFCDFAVDIGPRRSGDLESSVLENPSKFMKKMYSINELLKNKD